MRNIVGNEEGMFDTTTRTDARQRHHKATRRQRPTKTRRNNAADTTPRTCGADHRNQLQRPTSAIATATKQCHNSQNSHSRATAEQQKRRHKTRRKKTASQSTADPPSPASKESRWTLPNEHTQKKFSREKQQLSEHENGTVDASDRNEGKYSIKQGTAMFFFRFFFRSFADWKRSFFRLLGGVAVVLWRDNNRVSVGRAAGGRHGADSHSN